VSNLRPGMKELLQKLVIDTNVPWLEYADDYQSDCAYIYFWSETLHEADCDESPDCGEFFGAGLSASLDFVEAEEMTAMAEDRETIRNFWQDKKWQWVKFWDATMLIKAVEGADEEEERAMKVLEDPIKGRFIEFAKPWIDFEDEESLKSFSKKHYQAFKDAWIIEMRKEAPTDEDIFGNIWNLDASPDPVDDIKEEDEPESEEEESKPVKEQLIFAGSTAWVSEITGEIKLSKNSPGEDWMLIESVNTGDTGEDGEILFVPSVLEGVRDWWIGLGNPESDLDQVSKTKIIISGAGEYSKSWLRRYFFVKDKEGDLVISY